MTSIPFKYSVQNILMRKITTFFTVLGLALVVFVFSSVLMLDAGLKETLVSTGENDNVIVTRRGAVTEIQLDRQRERYFRFLRSPLKQ